MYNDQREHHRSSVAWTSSGTVVVLATAAPPCGAFVVAKLARACGSGPRIQLTEDQHNFGKADVGVGGRHAFVVTNVGDEPLELSRGKATCGCCTCVCTVQLPESALAPGDSAELILQWKSKLYVGPFRQTTTILTNDPQRREVMLSVAGRFTGPVGVVPSQLAIGLLRVGQAATRDVCIYSYLPESLDITGLKLSNPQTADYFDVTWDCLSVEEVREEGEAQSGYRVHVEVRPGLPSGAFQQTITLQTTSKSVPRVEIPVQGAVVSDISVAGRGWNAQTGVVSMGTVARSDGVAWPLMIVVRGPLAKDVRLSHVGSVPDWLAVELEPTRYSADTAVALTRLKIRIPPGSPASQHLGNGQGELGRVTMQFDSPSLPNLEILVRFAVGP